MRQHDMSTDDEDLFEVYASGRQTGFAGQLADLAGAQVINVAMHPWRARDWLVTLGAMKKGNVPVTGTVAGVPPDNQVAIALGASAGAGPEVANYKIHGIYVKVFWGTGNSLEQAFVSWPFGGSTLSLHGALVRVEVPPGFSLGNLNAGQFLPMLTGFITPNARRDGGMLSPPTLFCNGGSMASAAQMAAGIDMWAPPRAVGYRLWTSVDVDAVFSPIVRVSEILWLGGVPVSIAAMAHTNASLYRAQSNSLEEQAGGGLAGQRGTGQPNDWRHLMPGSVGIHVDITNGQNGADVDVGAEWILDIG